MKRKKTEVSTHVQRWAWCLMVVAALGLTGCAATKQPRGPLSSDIQKSGFLEGIYPAMKEGAKGQPLLVYRNPKIDSLPANAYDKLLLDNVQIFVGTESSLNDAPKEEAQKLANLFSGELVENLSKDYAIVDNPGPKTLRIQIALTDAKATSSLKLITFVPWGVPGLKFAVFKSKELATGKPVVSGEVTAEVKMTDAQTGEILFAAADRRVGGRLGGGWKSWTDAEQACRYWAEKISYGLCKQLQHRTDCVAPKE